MGTPEETIRQMFQYQRDMDAYTEKYKTCSKKKKTWGIF